MDEPLPPDEAERLILWILEFGAFDFSPHSFKELENDRLSTVDAVNVLRGGVVGPGEYEKGSWRYRVSTQRMTVVVAFRSETEFVVVTCWRNKRRGGR